jgi:membrane AbrB-like protein
VVESLALAAAGATLGRLSRLPSGAMLVTLFAGAFLHVEGIVSIELPQPVLAATYAVLGWTVGLTFTPDILWHALRALPKIFMSIMALIAFCAGLAFILTEVWGVSALTAYLATSPGGMDSVAIIASSSHVDVPFVMALQASRFLLILLIGPPIARFIARQIDPKAAPRPDCKLEAAPKERRPI